MVFKFFLKLLLIFLNINIINGFDLCVVGASSGLGREIIYQFLNIKNKNNKNMKILGLTSNPANIKIPYRGGGLNNKNSNLLLRSPNLIISEYNDFVNYNFSNIVLTTGAQPFQKDYSDILTNNILFDKNNENNNKNNENNEICKLKNIVLISAHGVGDSLANSNLGIKIMNNLYLQDTYRAKNIQEELVKKYKKNNPETNIKIYRPKALSYGTNIYSAKPREELAKEIIYHITMNNYISTL